MKAAVLYKPHDMRMETWPVPKTVGPDQVLIRIKYVGVCGSDVHYYQDGRIGDFVVKHPTVLGHESSGVIVKTGSRVNGLKAGDRVAIEPGVPCGQCECCISGRYNQCKAIEFFGTFPTHGTYRENVVHPARWVYKLPPGISLQEGAMLEPLSVSVHAVNLSGVGACHTIAVLGMGSIGLTCLQILRMNRAHTIFATDRIVPRLKLARKLGADRIINIRQEDPVRAILRETGGRGVDLVFEAAGQLDAHHHAAEVLRPGGEMVIIGIPPEDRLGFKAGTVRRKELVLTMVRRMRYTYGPSLDLVRRGLVDVKCLVTHTYSLKNIVKAFKLVEDYADGVIKAVIKI